MHARATFIASQQNALATHLRRSDWMQLLPEELASYVTERTLEKNVPVGEFVYARGMPPEFWVGVIEGLLLMCRYSDTGRATAVASAKPGEWIGEASLMFLKERRFDLVAVRHSRLAYVPRSVFRRLYEESIPFNHYLVEKLARRMGRFARLVSSDRLLSPLGRVALCLSSLIEGESLRAGAPHVNVTQAEIGTLTGLSRQHVNKALHGLQASNVVSIERSGVWVTDLAALLHFVAHTGN
jgi:CRP-like cAMP-binding protein